MIFCQKCNEKNPPKEQTCQKCGADLLPPESGMFGRSRNTPLYERYQLRAEGHIHLDGQQAITDLDRAIELAPDKKIPELVARRCDWLRNYPVAMMCGVVRAMQIMPECDNTLYDLPEAVQQTIVGAVKRKVVLPDESPDSARNGLCLYYLHGFDAKSLDDPNIDQTDISLYRAVQEMELGGKIFDHSLPFINRLETLVKDNLVHSLGYCPDCKDVVRVLDTVSPTSMHHFCIQGHKMAKLHGYALPDEFEALRQVLRERLALGYKIISSVFN